MVGFDTNKSDKIKSPVYKYECSVRKKNIFTFLCRLVSIAYKLCTVKGIMCMSKPTWNSLFGAGY